MHVQARALLMQTVYNILLQTRCDGEGTFGLTAPLMDPLAS